MYIPFQQLPGTARIWIYQSDRALSLEDEKILSDALMTFCNQWAVHGEPMDTSFEIRYNRLLVLAANDHASGCSIDSSVRIVKDAGTKVGVDFFNRGLVAFLESGKVHVVPMADLKGALARGEWN